VGRARGLAEVVHLPDIFLEVALELVEEIGRMVSTLTATGRSRLLKFRLHTPHDRQYHFGSDSIRSWDLDRYAQAGKNVTCKIL
jgi:hypothetical protein